MGSHGERRGVFLKPLSCVIIGAPPHQCLLCYLLEIQSGDGNAIQFLSDAGLMWLGMPHLAKARLTLTREAASGEAQEGAVSTFAHPSPTL